MLKKKKGSWSDPYLLQTESRKLGMQGPAPTEILYLTSHFFALQLFFFTKKQTSFLGMFEVMVPGTLRFIWLEQLKL